MRHTRIYSWSSVYHRLRSATWSWNRCQQSFTLKSRHITHLRLPASSPVIHSYLSFMSCILDWLKNSWKLLDQTIIRRHTPGKPRVCTWSHCVECGLTRSWAISVYTHRIDSPLVFAHQIDLPLGVVYTIQFVKRSKPRIESCQLLSTSMW